MVSFGVDLDAPRPPFVLAKLLARSPLGRVLLPPWWLLLGALKFCTRALASVVGFVWGVVGGGGGGELMAPGGGARLPVARDARIPRPSWGPDLSLLDDEYI